MTLTIALTGDSMITRGAPVRADARSQAVRDLVRSADVAFTNLEVVPGGYRGYPAAAAMMPTLAAPASVLDDLADLGFDVLSVANNHAMNMGIEGMLAALGEIDARGLGHCGAGLDLASASQPAYIDRPAGSVAFIAAASTFGPGEEAARPSELMRGRPGLNPLRYDTALEVTAEQFAALADVHARLGMAASLASLRETGFAPAAAPGEEVMFGALFRESDQTAVRTACRPADLDRICRWTSEAAARADVTVVSVHSHESGSSLLDPAEFLVEFAHAVIDAGADIVAGHGDHRLRAVELYRGRPVFYGLGGFITQFELQTVLSSHVYDVFGAAPGTPGHEVIDMGRLGFAAHPEYWRGVLPVLSYGPDGLEEIRLHPVTLGFGQPAPRRGRPALAPDQVTETLGGLAELSAARGTRLHWEDGLARVVLPRPGEGGE
jgi:poly-gamma-glutamate synthesis protein (capsule biosynthesis protein)